MNRLDNFNCIAPYYDFLKGLVFGSAIRQSQECFLPRLPKAGSVLVIGGGSGEIVPELIKASAAAVYYVEASSEMLARTRQRVPAEALDRVQLIYGTEESLPPELRFDAVITCFFLDLFSDKELNPVCKRLAGHLHDGGLWIVSDFVDDGRWWQRGMLWLMYRFFSVAAGVTTKRLPDWATQVEAAGMTHDTTASFFRGFIKTRLYRKNGR